MCRRGGERIDLATEKERFVVFQKYVTVGELHATLAERFDLPALQCNTRFKAVFDVIFEAGPFVQSDGFFTG